MHKPPTMMQNIPNDAIHYEILPRLPVKSILRFKAVCKHWYNLFSTSQFIKKHLHLSLVSPLFLAMIDDQSYKFHTFTYDEQSNIKELVELDSGWTHESKHTKYDLIGCCNGLVCLKVTTHEHESGSLTYFIVWNPSTRQSRKINSPSEDGFSWTEFGYALSHDDYKIVGIVRSRVWVFSLREGNWKLIVETPFHDFEVKNGAFVCDILYWCVRKSVNLSNYVTTHLISFNVVDEIIEEIPLSILPNAHIQINLYVIKGCLSVHRNDEPHDVWMLKKQGDCKSWEKLFTSPIRVMNQRGITWDGKILAEHWGKLVLVHPKCDSLQDYLDSADCVDVSNWSYRTPQHVESLISPFGATEQLKDSS